MSRALSTRRAAHKSSKLLKKLPEEVKLIRQAYPTAAVDLWRSDDHRSGLKPILRRVWARRGSRVSAVVRQR